MRRYAVGRVALDDSPLTGMVKMAEGNIGAATVLSELFREGATIDPQSDLGGFGPVLQLDDMEIYGSHIWILYKYICKEDLRSMVALIRARQLGIISQQELKAAIAAGKKNTLDVPAIVAQVEEQIEDFQRAPVVQ